MGNKVTTIILIALAILGTIVAWSGFVILKRSMEHSKDERSKIKHIINGCTEDPIEALYHVRKYILENFKYAETAPIWYDNAYAAMINWLRSDEGTKLGFTHIHYVLGDKLGLRSHWIRCRNDKTNIQLIIDLTVELQILSCHGGDMIVVGDAGDGHMKYLCSKASPHYKDYRELRVIQDPDYTLI